MNMEKEYIERYTLIAEYDRVHPGPPGGARQLMVDAPAADVVEVRHGKWAWTERGAAYCTACKQTMIPPFWGKPYCSLCGAKMDLEVRQ